MHFTRLHIIELALLAGAFAILMVGAWQQMSHLKAVPRIDSAADLDAFKGFARRQMYLTLGLLGLAVPAIALIFVDTAATSLAQKFILWAPYGLLGIAGVLTKAQEKRIRNESRCAPELRTAFGDVCHNWTKRMLPNF
jgi:hypothetical protein